jgi:hypothetical protein
MRGNLLVSARFVGIFVGIVRAHGDDTNMLNDTRVRNAKHADRPNQALG